jgi:hypothetical protein
VAGAREELPLGALGAARLVLEGIVEIGPELPAE